MADIVEASRTSTLELQNQLDEYKDKNRRELAEMQRQLKEKTLDAEKARLTATKLQDEVISGQTISFLTSPFQASFQPALCGFCEGSDSRSLGQLLCRRLRS